MTRRGWVLFASMSVIWGTPYLLTSVAVTSLSPFVVVFGRSALAAVILLPLALLRGQLPRLRPYLPWVVVFAAVELVFPWLCLTFAQTRLTSSLTGLLIAAVPIASAVIAVSLRLDDRFTGTRMLGLSVGFVGVGALVGLDVGGSDLIAAAALIVTVIGYAIGPVVVATRLRGAPDLAVIAAALSINALVYAPLAWLTRPTTPVPTEAWLSVLGLGVVCTALAFALFFALIAEVGPSRTTVITYLNPAVAVTLGVLILGEPITLGIVLGFPLVLLGSFLATRRPAAASSRT